MSNPISMILTAHDASWPNLRLPFHADASIEPLYTTPDQVRDHMFGFTVNGTSGDVDVSASRIITYSACVNDINQYILVYMLNTNACPVSVDCGAHSMLVAVMSNDAGYVNAYDFPLMVLNGGITNAHIIGSAGSVSAAIMEAARSTMSSMHWRAGTCTTEMPYAATVYTGLIKLVADDSGHVIAADIPAEKRLITHGESLTVDGRTSSRVYLYNGYVDGNMHPVPHRYIHDGTVIDMYEAVPQPDQTVDESEFVNGLRMTIDEQRAAINELRAMLETARTACINATRDHGGCDEGKIMFLTSTGLWPELDRDEIGALVGIECEVEHKITVSLELTLSTSYEMTPSVAEDISPYNVSDYVDVNDLLIDNIRYVDFDITDVEVEEA